jgi:hypothetical protein
MKLRPFQLDKQNFNVDQILDLVCFRVKLFFFLGKSGYFSLVFCNPKNGSRNIFRHLACMKNHQIFLIFSYNIRNCEEEKKRQRKGIVGEESE